MNLYRELTSLRIKYAKLLPAERTAVMDAHMEFLRSSGAMDRIVKPGDRAPEFELADSSGRLVSSAEALRRGPLVLSFFRGAWCPYCVEETKALSDAYEAIRAEGAELMAISPQVSSASSKQEEDGRLAFRILVDEENRVGKAFGLVYAFTSELRSLYSETFRLDVAAKNGSREWELPIPARIVVGSDGIVRDVKADPDYRFRPEAEDTVAFLKEMNRRERAGAAHALN